MPITAPPRLLGDRYDVGDLIARGGMSEVRRGHDRRLDRAVAIKLLDPHAPDEAAQARFLAEAQVVARLSHPHLVTVLDTGVTDDRPWLIMELVPGNTLGDAIATGPLSPVRTREIGMGLAQALAVVHAAGVVHRDVKPANVLLGTADDRVRLTDFGVARLIDGGAELTRTHQTVGTAPYLAPEQLRGEQVTGAADVFALGLVLIECLTGTRAYPGTGLAAMTARLHHPPTIPSDLTGPLSTLLIEMTDLDPLHRPQAAEVAERLRMSVAGAPDGSTRLLTAAVDLPEQRTGAPYQPRSAHTWQTAGDSLAQTLSTLRGRWADTTERNRASILLAIALVALLSIAALARGDANNTDTPARTREADRTSSSERPTTDIPSRTPARYRDPLTRLHQEINR